MKNLLFGLLFLIWNQILYSQSDNYRLSNFTDYKNISLELHFGSSAGDYESVRTNFYDANHNYIKIVTNGGIFAGGSVGYVIGVKLDLLLGYDYLQSNFLDNYDNGYGIFGRHVFYPMIKYSPLITKKARFILGCGINSILNSKIESSFDFPNGNQKIIYDYKSSFGPLFLTEFQIYYNNWISSSIAIKYNINRLEISTTRLNDVIIDNSNLFEETKGFKTNCLLYYISLSFHLL
jgi:hypothetical protein